MAGSIDKERNMKIIKRETWKLWNDKIAEKNEN